MDSLIWDIANVAIYSMVKSHLHFQSNKAYNKGAPLPHVLVLPSKINF
jgi:hypothetical protein